MILVVSLSPALDVTYFVPEIVQGKSHSVSRYRKVAGGKGVNVASVLKILGEPTKLLLPLGGATGKRIEAELLQRNLDAEVINIQAETRTSVSVVSDDATVFNEPASPLTQEEFQQLSLRLENLAQHSKVTVFSGSVPKSISPAEYAQLIYLAKRSGSIVIADSSGEYLKSAISAKAHWVKPNRDELIELVGQTNEEAAISSLKTLGLENALVSLGDKGAWLTSNHAEFNAITPKLAGNPTGAGDAMVAGLAGGLARDLSPEDLLRQASALGAAAVLEEVAGQVELSKYQELLAQIKIQERAS